MSDLISIIVATYNRPDALDAVLRSLARQTDPDFEVIVADDGSTSDTKAVIDHWNGRVGRRVVHVWHADEGFRLAEIRNRAILAAAGDYCIFLDGDCLVRPNFIAAHRVLAERGWFVAGNRVLLSRELSERILRERLTAERWDELALAAAAARRQDQSSGAAVCLAARAVPGNCVRGRGVEGAAPISASGAPTWCAIDGFDCDFAGWGREDSDVFVRLMRAGVRRKVGRWATGVLRLWHPEADRSRTRNDLRLEQVLSGDRVVATKGLSTLREEQTKTPTGVH